MNELRIFNSLFVHIVTTYTYNMATNFKLSSIVSLHLMYIMVLVTYHRNTVYPHLPISQFTFTHNTDNDFNPLLSDTKIFDRKTDTHYLHEI